MEFTHAERLNVLPPYLFAEIARKRREAVAAGKDVINFGVGDPDQPTPGFIVQKLQQAAADPATHQYPMDHGSPQFREAAARWFQRRFGVGLDPEQEVLMLIGSKEGLGHLPLAALNPGQVALIPSPGYPVYRSASIFAGGVPCDMPLSARHNWLPDLDAIPANKLRAARLLFLNYPNNPTGAVAPLSFLEQAVQFAARHRLLIVQDAAYSEMTYDVPSPSILQLSGGKEHAVELYSLSKTYNMTGWRIGFAVGNAAALAALAKIKNNMDSGQFTAIQSAAVDALDHADHPDVRRMIDVYRERRDVLVDGLNRCGWKVSRPSATFYVWAAVPGGQDSMHFATRLLEEANVVVVPGIGFGKEGEGYVRFALTVSTERIRQSLDRLARFKL